MSVGSRQQPGSACEECRKRKLRCDRQRPQCGTCSDAGITCEVNTHCLPRGPRKGNLKALRSRVGTLHGPNPSTVSIPVTLEGRLHEQQADGLLDREQYIHLTEETPAENSVSDEEQGQSSSSKPHSDGELPSPRQFMDVMWSTLPATPRGTFISELMRADLDQLYFDRVHPIVPILHKCRYFSWGKQSAASEYRICLQYAMWTLAMSLSTQFENIRDMLYTETRQMLEALDLCENDIGLVHIEEAQAWILVTFYEFLRTNYRRGWISAGRAFRLVQLLRLHEVDSPKNKIGQLNAVANEDWIATEEKRRTYWVAYCLDRFVSVRNGWPLTLNEEVICTRLPALEADFQSGHPMQVCFLSEAIAFSDHSLFSPLAECAILVTIYGRALSHNQVSTVEQVYGNASLDFWLRHEWLDSMLTKRMESFSLNYPTVSIFADPMLLFTFMVVQTTIIYLCKIMEPLGDTEQYKATVIEYQKRALWAAREIARLSKEHGHIGYFKASHPSAPASAHVFMPVAIFLGAERLITHRYVHKSDLQTLEDQSLDLELQGCLEVLRKMQSVNNLAKYHLHILESGDFKGSCPLQ
ncbi:MAG: hypothetical protein M1830_009014 [Pleopsidium flavum]|nr:MAG: hypothetical protein M1830_009014 [Pleopsidium flavum]